MKNYGDVFSALDALLGADPSMMDMPPVAVVMDGDGRVLAGRIVSITAGPPPGCGASPEDPGRAPEDFDDVPTRVMRCLAPASSLPSLHIVDEDDTVIEDVPQDDGPYGLRRSTAKPEAHWARSLR